MTVFTAIFGPYDDLKEPFFVTPGWKYVCFTDQDFKSDVWEIRKVPIQRLGARKTARYYKIMFHEHIEDEYSLWVDGTFFINCDLDRWWRRFKEPFTTVAHPFDKCVYVEIESCKRGGKGRLNTLNSQKAFYSYQRLPKNNGLIASGVLMRQNTPEVREFCKLWWEQVQAYSERDQIAFAYVNFKVPNAHHSIEWNYTKETEFIHVPHLNKHWRKGRLDEVIKKYGSKKTA